MRNSKIRNELRIITKGYRYDVARLSCCIMEQKQNTGRVLSKVFNKTLQKPIGSQQHEIEQGCIVSCMGTSERVLR